MDFESTGLWKRTLDESAGALNSEERERLRVAYKRFWKNACQLAAQIGRDLPNLTLHDEQHFEALWERADQIAGDELRLTPLEMFVFGGAILLHDAGNTAAAFEGGLEEIQQTPEWRDAIAAIAEQPDSASTPPDPASQQDVLIATLRSLHAKQAKKLGTREFRNSTTGGTEYLIEDAHIRNHLGSLIGEIAASHHWDIGRVENELSPQIGAISGFPKEWIIRPILLACLLRCADAIQIDQRRVPDFLMALLTLRGVSEQHWLAQNLLTAPSPDPSDPKALIFSSSRPYSESEADAWWVAYDAIRTAHGELQACGVLLNDLRLPTFAIDRIRNAESPIRLSETVRTSGWRPISAEIHINHVKNIVEMFGGEQLYGHEPQVALRELIQNSIDAVCQRRIFESKNANFTGSITVKLIDEKIGDRTWLIVEDDGLGMSEAALTGPLIDFGGSYIASRLAQQERPGLSAATKRRIGRFGIGFFSVFMLSDHVLVCSRPYDESLNRARTLSFRTGLTLRPLLLDSRPGDFGGHLSTRVSVRLSKDKLEHILSPAWGHQSDRLTVTLCQLVQALCPFSSVDIFVQQNGEERTLARKAGWPPNDLYSWLQEINVAGAREDPSLDENLASSTSRLRPLDPGDPMAGVAAINFSAARAGVPTIGGMRSGSRWGNYSEIYVGTFDHNPDGPD